MKRREFITLFGGAAVGTILLVEGTGVPERHVAIQNVLGSPNDFNDFTGPLL